MAHTPISIRFRFLRLPVVWEVSENPKAGPYFHGQLEVTPEKKDLKLVELDGWALRDQFFGLPENNIDRLAEFLNKVGVWSSDPDEAALDISRYPLSACAEEVWRFREDLRWALLYQRPFIAQVAAESKSPRTRFDLISRPHRANQFQLRFEITDVVAGVVTILNARHMLFTTVLADVASGIRFKICQRKDCRKPFPIESEHARKFCSQPCGHLVSQRKKRAAKRKKKARNSLP
jgi:hypothetical protein